MILEDDRGEHPNALNLSPEHLNRPIEYIDIQADEKTGSPLEGDEDILTFKSEKTGRGPLKEGLFKRNVGVHGFLFLKTRGTKRFPCKPRPYFDHVKKRTKKKLFHISLIPLQLCCCKASFGDSNPSEHGRGFAYLLGNPRYDAGKRNKNFSLWLLLLLLFFF